MKDGLGVRSLRDDHARLEAFLAAVPGEYCGWGEDGALAYSEGFCKILGLEQIGAIEDIQNALDAGDAAALETLFTRLRQTGDDFRITVRNSARTAWFSLSGTCGRDRTGQACFHILWLEDITQNQLDSKKQAQLLQEAQDARALIERQFDLLPIPLWMRDGDGKIIWCNNAYAALAGVSPASVLAEQKELQAKPAKRGGDNVRMAGMALARAALDSGAAAQTYAHIIQSGKRHFYLITETPLSARHGAQGAGDAATLGMASDVTREEELEAEQQRHALANRELLEQLGTAIAIFDAEQKLAFYNSAFSQLWDLEDVYLNSRPRLGDMMEKLRAARLLPEQADFKRFKQSWLDMFTRLIGAHEDMLYLPNDSALRMLVVPHPMGGLMMNFEDVTSRLALESSYNTLIAVQKETLDNLSEGVAVFGGDGRLRLWNPAFAQLWGLHPEDLAAEPHISRLIEKLQSRFGAEDWEQTKTSLLEQALDRNVRSGQMETGTGTLIAYSTVPLPDGGVLVTHINVTDTARVEKALREKNAALEAAERLKLDFLANVSYQLRTPLSSMLGFAEILDKEFFGPLNPRQKEYTAGMQDAGARLLNLINDILDLSTLEAGFMSLDIDKVDVRDILEGLHALTSEWARTERIEVELDCPADIGVIEADERRLKQVLLNLIRNAITHTDPGGRIILQARRTDQGRVVVIVRDNGKGIAPADQERIFQPFERVQAGEHQSGQPVRERGAGLGLTLVRDIVELHGGQITLDSTEGVGTDVIISLPPIQSA